MRPIVLLLYGKDGVEALVNGSRFASYAPWMSRPLRIHFPGATYHVLDRELASHPISTKEKDFQEQVRSIRHQLVGRYEQQAS